ncbi:hypothetical protein N2152v2_000509 [Parachlorella kessleri]
MGSVWDEPPSIAVPAGLADLLKDFAKAAIKLQPADLLSFGSEYFDGLRRDRALQSGPRPKLRVIISGPPAAGKGTQCAKIVEQFGLCHISVGDLLRAEVANQTEAGLAAKHFMDNGDLVPDELVVGMVKQRLAQPDTLEKGWLLDGYPRSAVQAEALETQGIYPDVFLLVQVPDEVLVDRVSGRRLDPETGEIYHLAFKPPPEGILGRLVQRSDDTEDKVRTRLVAYHQHVAAVVDRYRDMLVEVDGNRSMEHVWADVEAALTGKQLEKIKLEGVATDKATAHA